MYINFEDNVYFQTASYFMTYHTPLHNSYEYITALKNARLLAQNIERMLYSNVPDLKDVSVFPYSFFYVFYEQYLTIWRSALVNILSALASIFLVALVFFSFNVVAALSIVFVIFCIIVDLFGLMYFWNISFCAVSLVNIIMVRIVE